ncbi:MAG: peptidoglycan DD-metalloendopeptidase family protein [Gallionella sp.]|nr:peptidoglycan DD-metalloendopeptidase family protein [Gallionella sp.]MDD5611608.1 peptidoglycan DD-metalloendopeptidase family protein [Gallionella sp.]
MKLIRALLFALCCLNLAGLAHASQQEELDNLRKRIAEMQGEIAKTSESKSEAADALRASEREISDSNRKLAVLVSQQQDADRKLEALRTQRKQLDTDMSKQQVLLGKLLYQQYLGGKHDYLRLMLDNQDPNQVARDLQYYQYIARNRSHWLADLRQHIADLNAVSQEIQTQSAALDKLRTEQTEQQKILQQKKLEHKQVLSQVSKELRQQRQEVSRLQHNENRLANLVTRISKMLAQPKSSSLFRNDNLPDNRFDGRPFDQLKGKLTLPVKGEIINQFGANRPDSTIPWKGLFVRAPSGQEVKAVAAGRVVFADWLRGFGNLLIIDHGNTYMTLYGNNETLYKQVGDELRGGETVAAVGSSGGNSESGLYFELRYESKPLDPLKWMAKK